MYLLCFYSLYITVLDFYSIAKQEKYQNVKVLLLQESSVFKMSWKFCQQNVLKVLNVLIMQQNERGLCVRFLYNICWIYIIDASMFM